jgi:hypothetical protein
MDRVLLLYEDRALKRRQYELDQRARELDDWERVLKNQGATLKRDRDMLEASRGSLETVPAPSFPVIQKKEAREAALEESAVESATDTRNYAKERDDGTVEDLDTRVSKKPKADREEHTEDDHRDACGGANGQGATAVPGPQCTRLDGIIDLDGLDI